MTFQKGVGLSFDYILGEQVSQGKLLIDSRYQRKSRLAFLEREVECFDNRVILPCGRNDRIRVHKGGFGWVLELKPLGEGRDEKARAIFTNKINLCI